MNELAAALGDDANFSTTVTNSLALKAPLASPTFTGTPAAPTATAGTNTTQIATTAFVSTAVDDVSTHDYRNVTSAETLVLADKGKTIQGDSTSAFDLTVPPNSSVAYPIGTIINVAQWNSAQITLAPGSGVTLNAAVGLKTRQQWSMVTLHKYGTDTWFVTGDATA